VAEDELRFHSQLFESIRESLIATDLDGNVTYWGPGAESLYQYRAEELMGKAVTILVEPGQRVKGKEWMRQVRQSDCWSGVSEQVRKDGSTFWAERVICLVRNEKGTPIGHTITDRDVTDRVRMEQALRALEASYQDLEDNAPDMHVTVDARTATVLACNQTLATAVGRSKGEIVGQAVFDLYHPDSLDDARKAFAMFVATGEVRDAELQLIRSDGTSLDVSLNVTAVRDKQGRIVRSRSCLRDISRRKRVEEQLRQLNLSLEQLVDERTTELCEQVKERRRAECLARQAELKYRTVADFTYDWEWWHDTDGTFRYMSPSSTRITGYEPAQFLDNPDLLRQIILQEDRETWDEHRRTAVGQAGLLEIQFRIRREDGQIRWIEHACQRVVDDSGKFRGFRASNRDITARKQAEISLRDALDEVARLKEQLAEENLQLKEAAQIATSAERPVGRSAAWTRVMHRAGQVAPTDASVLLLGETGTGKSRIAQLIHGFSKRSQRPLVNFNCAALPSSLIESELFGHEKGAFTGAVARRIGRFEVADGGAAFLDEIGDLTTEVQAKLLRILDNGEFERLGSTDTVKVDVRIIAATNRDLERAVAEGSFREDLYYRIGVFPITLPPLRERRDDIPLLAWYFITKYKGILGKRIDTISEDMMDFLMSYDWPGNVRELENVIERAMILSPGTALRIVDPPAAQLPTNTVRYRPKLKRLDELERAHILTVLDECGWKVKGNGNAADQLGLKPSTLFARMKKHRIRRPKSSQG